MRTVTESWVDVAELRCLQYRRRSELEAHMRSAGLMVTERTVDYMCRRDPDWLELDDQRRRMIHRLKTQSTIGVSNAVPS